MSVSYIVHLLNARSIQQVGWFVALFEMDGLLPPDGTFRPTGRQFILELDVLLPYMMNVLLFLPCLMTGGLEVHPECLSGLVRKVGITTTIEYLNEFLAHVFV